MILQADTLLWGGPIYTADPRQPWTEAVAVREGHILAVGRRTELEELRGPRTQGVELHGRLLLPAFTESHIHFIEVAARAAEIDVTSAASPGEVADRVRERAAVAPAGSWILGGGWDANLWPDGQRVPHRELLDRVAPGNPVMLWSKDLHSAWLNSAALARAGITAGSPGVAGGVIERDASGAPTGILREDAVELAFGQLPTPTLHELAAAARVAVPGLWKAGIVAIHNASDAPDMRSFRTYQELKAGDGPRLRVLQQIPVGNLEHARRLGLRSGFGDRWLRIGGVKIFADGALGSRTASMLQPYVGEPDNWGVPTTDPEELLEQALAAATAGLSLTIHAIGDRANRDVLDVLAEVRAAERGSEGGRMPLRHRIEHVQCIHPEDLPRLARLGVIASVQPLHATSDMFAVDRYWGPERAPHAYPFRQLLDSGARLVFGSDAPVEPYPPLLGIHAAVTRRRTNGAPGPAGWQGQERITVAEAVDAYTRWPAFAAGEENYRGSITPGKVADLTILSENIFQIDPMAICDVAVDQTLVEGNIVWQRRGSPPGG